MCAKNINNEKIMNLDPEGFMGVFIIHESCPLVEIRGWITLM
jgi:hypothetical protein